MHAYASALGTIHEEKEGCMLCTEWYIPAHNQVVARALHLH